MYSYFDLVLSAVHTSTYLNCKHPLFQPLSYAFSERHRTFLLHHMRMSLIDRSGLGGGGGGGGGSGGGGGGFGGGGEPHAERSPKSHYNDEVRAVEAFILVEEIMRRRYNVSVRGVKLDSTHQLAL